MQWCRDNNPRSSGLGPKCSKQALGRYATMIDGSCREIDWQN